METKIDFTGPSGMNRSLTIIYPKDLVTIIKDPSTDLGKKTMMMMKMKGLTSTEETECIQMSFSFPTMGSE